MPIAQCKYFLYILHKNCHLALCTYPNFSYDGFSSLIHFLITLLIYARIKEVNKNEQQLPIPDEPNSGIQPTTTNLANVPSTARKCLCNKFSARHWERTNRKHRLVSRHLPRRKSNVYKILPKWSASHNGLPRFSFSKRGKESRGGVRANRHHHSADFPRTETKHTNIRRKIRWASLIPFK